MFMTHECQDRIIHEALAFDEALSFDAIQAQASTAMVTPQEYGAVAFAARHLCGPELSAAAPRNSGGEIGNSRPSHSKYDKGRGLANAVLVVDDDADALDEMAETLCEFGLTVLTAGNGPEALDLARIHRPRCVIMDFDLPAMNGLDTITEMRRFIPLATFIMISGHDDFCHVATTKNTKTIAILKKPVCMTGVARFIKTKFESTTGRSPKITSMMMP